MIEYIYELLKKENTKLVDDSCLVSIFNKFGIFGNHISYCIYHDDIRINNFVEFKNVIFSLTKWELICKFNYVKKFFSYSDLFYGVQQDKFSLDMIPYAWISIYNDDKNIIYSHNNIKKIIKNKKDFNLLIDKYYNKWDILIKLSIFEEYYYKGVRK